MPQTVEHLDILTLLGIRDGVVVITKTDMVDEEWVEIVREDIAAHVKGTFLEGKPVLPVSAYTGQGLDEHGLAVIHMTGGAEDDVLHASTSAAVSAIYSMSSGKMVRTSSSSRPSVMRPMMGFSRQRRACSA